MALRTGFEGYCDACGSAFECLDLYDAPTLKVLFGSEVFGPDRFSGTASKRSRTWHLKGNNRGANNRFSIFQATWLSGPQLQEAETVRLRIEDNAARTTCARELSSWVGARRGDVARALNTNGADKSTYATALTRLVDAIGEARDALDGVVGACAGPAGDQRAWLSDLERTCLPGCQPEATMSQMADALARARAMLSDRKRVLAEQRSALKRELRALSDERERIETAFPEMAVANCVAAMLDDGSSLLWNALRADKYGFVNAFSTVVVPAIEEGFHAEGYSDERIVHFRHLMDDHMNRLSTARQSVEELFRTYLTDLVSSLVYGPETVGAGAGTLWEDAIDLAIDEPSGRQIQLTQLFTPDGRYLGKSRTFDADDVVFVGRSDDMEGYEARWAACMAEGEAASFGARNAQLFLVSEEHGQVSNFHGVLFCEDETWMFLDFSTFGTRIVGRGKDGEELDVHVRGGFRELEAGSVLYLGAREQDADERRLFRKAAALKLSFFLDEHNIVYNTL